MPFFVSFGRLPPRSPVLSSYNLSSFVVPPLLCHADAGDNFRTHAGVAQSVEQRTRNAKVVGSIPISGTI